MTMSKLYFMTNSLAAGGAEKVITVLLNKLSELGIDVELICLEHNDFYHLSEDIKRTYLSDFTGKEAGVKKLFTIPLLAWRLKQYIKKENITLVQSHIYRSNYINILAKLFGSSHNVQIVNAGTMSKYKKEGLLGKINLLLIKYLYPKSDLIILKSQGMQLDMQELFNFQCENIIINNPYDIEKIEYMKKETIDDFDFRTDKKYLISVGRFETFKRQDIIIRSMKNLIHKQDIELILIGDGIKKDKLIQLSKELGVANKVHFLGRVSNPYKYIARSDAYILSSENGEGFPNVLVESMICKTPVISSDCISGPREILAPDTSIDFQLKEGIEKTKYGILFSVGNVDSLNKAIKQILDNEELKETYKEKAYERVHDFAVEKIVEQYKEILNV